MSVKSALLGIELSNLILLSSISGYNVWYRHTQQPHIDRIPVIQYNQLQSMTYSQLVDITHTLDITHMCISGDIPPAVHRIASNLKQLKLWDIPHIDQLQQLVLS